MARSSEDPDGPPRGRGKSWIHTHGWLVFLGGMAALTAAYATAKLIDQPWLGSGPVFNLIGGSAVVALLAGAVKRPRGHRLPWCLFAIGQALFVLGDVLAYNYHRFFGTELPYPSAADAFYLAFYPALLGGLLLLIRERSAGDRGSLIDALTITVGAAALSWTYLMSPYAHDATLTLPTKLVSIAYPLMDVLVLGVLVRLTVASGRRATGLLLLLVGFGTLLATDSAYGWVLLHGTFKPGGVLDVGWAAFYALLGAAALHPSTRTVFNRDPQRQTRLTGRRIALLAAASLAAPTIMMTRTLPSSASLDIHILAAASVVMFALVLLRMTGLMRSSEGAVRREAERSAELAAAERSAAAKDAFVSQVSHELRTPLTSILGYLSLLQEGSADEPDAVERAGYLAVVERNADRLLRLVEDLLFVARIDDGEIALEESDFDLAELAAQSLESARPAAENRMIRLRFDAPAALQLRGDRSRLAQVIDNLLSNAIKFSSEDAEVTVDLARSNGTARLVVADTGIGMRPDEIGHLFERFYRTDGATSRAIQGTGLGLSIAKAIVEAHRGTITATSELGIGTSLTIALPVA